MLVSTLKASPRKVAHGRSVLELIGNTPLLGFKRIDADLSGMKVLGKAEWVNPGGSVKDRAALAMIVDGERRGLLSKDKILVDATSGNTGIAYAMICAERGYRVKLALPKNASEERKQTLRAYGADLVLTDPTEGTDGAQRFVKKLVENDPGKYFYPDQYNNPANWRAHYETTANEIWRQTDGQITHFVAGMGTSGTFVGVTKRLKELNPAIQCISMQPNSPLHGLEGMKHMASALVPGIYDPNLADDQIEVATEDAHRMVLRLAREEGILVGVSSGGNLVAAMQVAEKLKEGVVVTIFCDSAAKYLSEDFWHETAPPSFDI
ncbi:MAG TPA: cysteine synthase family protein [Tepidisphaeraceae bacterium]|nr:cysteine synthase family protein [Tepidisphaeraceae bacterium]